MKLYRKVLIVLATTVTLAVGANALVLELIVTPSFAELERANAERNANRVLDAIAGNLRFLDASARDWATWDATYEYIKSRAPEFAEENLTLESFRGININLMYLLDIGGEMVWGNVYDLDTGTALPLTSFWSARHGGEYEALTQAAHKGSASGLIMTEHAPMLVVARPILRTDGSGPSVGTMVFGRFLDDRALESLRRQVHVDFEILSRDTAVFDRIYADIGSRMKVNRPYVIQTMFPDRITIYNAVPDIAGDPAILLRIEMPRAISAVGRRTVELATLSLAAVGGIVMLVMLLIFRRVVIAPVTELTRHVLSIRQNGTVETRSPIDSRDEIGILAREFDAAVEQLAETRQKLVEQSFYTGMAELASGVMHNIRNALSPIAVIIWRLTQMSNAGDRNIIRALSELEDPDTPPDRRAKLIAYVRLVVEQLLARQHTLAKDLDVISRQSTHIEQILQDHELFSRSGRRLEQVDLQRAVADATPLLPSGGEIPISLIVTSALSKMPQVIGHQVVLTQILGNLILNAAESIAATDLRAGIIKIDAAINFVDDRPMVHLRVQDNGQGIEEDRLRLIFERGYTTRRSRSGGLGLHWCANSIAGMQGKMFATSDGVGTGATLHILLPAVTATPLQKSA